MAGLAGLSEYGDALRDYKLALAHAIEEKSVPIRLTFDFFLKKKVLHSHFNIFFTDNSSQHTLCQRFSSFSFLH